MRTSNHGRHTIQLDLFHSPRREPAWGQLSAEVRERTTFLLACLLRVELAEAQVGCLEEVPADE